MIKSEGGKKSHCSKVFYSADKGFYLEEDPANT